ncbi:other/PEK/GCN2 protein kinase [Coprinopsis marcescibilis]|uniref:non-specific serine/threonine protein kinase n=1 Tax=Coprinopsis marcescibilis TaxID=230819 RepID=A0A5C3KTX8_COPMA|nr:other/PEK/GCN2 protein kinase [Coprinopsis marcescibilis]
MDSTEELQQLEITALKSIFGNDFIECPPPKAWKGAARQHEFVIQVTSPDYPDKISVNLHVKLPKTYPLLACPTFTLQKPAKGLSADQLSKLQHLINAEAQKLRGNEMVFTIANTCQDWLVNNVKPPVEVTGSLALQMTQRALDEEKNRKQREAEQEAREEERRRREAQELEAQIEQDALRQLLARQEQQYQSRKRANSEATEVPFMSETPLETFYDEIEIEGVQFNTVKLFHPRKGTLGTVYLAEPVADDLKMVLPLELHVFTLESTYYTTSQGRKKLKQVEQEIKDLTTIHHDNLLSVFAVKLTQPHSSDPTRLIVLMEQAPSVTLYDVLGDCHSLREDRASQYLTQILQALNAIHHRNLVHRGIDARCIGLAPSRSNPSQKIIKIGKAVFQTHLLDLHRSNSFGVHVPPLVDEPEISDGWLSRDVKNESALLYTKRRDIHNVGIVLMQMLLGLDVTERFSDVQEAIHSSSISTALSRQATNMLSPTKKYNISCMSLLSELAEDKAMMMHQQHSPNSSRAQLSSRAIPISASGDPRTPVPSMYYGSPEVDYMTHQRVMRPRHASRWKDDWEELELLGKGAFGSVVKARNKIDHRIYAVKKVRLKAMQSDKIMREVNALSRLNHRFIVRYYTTWIETVEEHSTTVSDDSSAESSIVTDDWSDTSVPDDDNDGSDYLSGPANGHLPINGAFTVNMEDFDDLSASGSTSQSSFPSIHFERSSSPQNSDSSGEDPFESLFTNTQSPNGRNVPPAVSRTMYIQMEFVERQTLRERIDEGISEDEAWRLFHQIVDALAHMSNLGILHRDIKLTNIFIDANGDCKVGDFGLATSSLAAVDPSDVQLKPHGMLDSEMTLEVGTRLYIAPEVQNRGRGLGHGPRNQSKADMYSLGIVFFEMNYRFSTGSERIFVLEEIRKPGVIFPSSWDHHRTRQKEIITWLLQHDPDKRPTAVELSQSSLLPPRVEDEYFNQALGMMAKPDTPHYQTVLSLLFKQPIKASRGFLYDKDLERPEYLSLASAVQDRLATLFKMHGAVDIEPPLLLPVVDREDEKNHATFIDRMGNVVSLPSNLLVPFARLAAKGNAKRIKRYHIANIYRPNPVAGHPLIQKAAVFDIITQDLEYGPIAAGAEIIAVSDDILNSFPNLNGTYTLRVSHSKIVDLAMERVPAEQRNAVVEILMQSKSSPSQKRALLLKKGLSRSSIDELELLNESEDHLDDVIAKLEKISSSMLPLMRPAFAELKETLQHAVYAGVERQIVIHPLMLGNHHSHFKDGVLVELTHKSKPSNVLAAGGRYDSLIARHSPTLRQKSDALCAVGLQVALEKILAQLALFQSNYVKNLIKEERSFGYWSPRRCDVYVVSYHTGYLPERLEVVAYLWEHNISADIMYESAISDSEHERLESVCEREGILFTVCPRPRAGKQTQSAFKVKSILKGTEYDLSRSELASWLQYHIAEQKRIDVTTYGTANTMESIPSASISKDISVSSDVQLILPADVKKQRKQVKHMLEDRAYETSKKVKTSVQNGMPTVAVDVPPAVFDTMCKSSNWLTDEDAWKALVAAFPPGHTAYAHQIRESISKHKADGHVYVLLFAVKEERIQLLTTA